MPRMGTRLKSQIGALLRRHGCKCPVTDKFSKAGRQWLEAVELPTHRGSLRRDCNHWLRYAFIEAAQSCVHTPGPYRDYHHAKATRRDKKVATVATGAAARDEGEDCNRQDTSREDGAPKKTHRPFLLRRHGAGRWRFGLCP